MMVDIDDSPIMLVIALVKAANESGFDVLDYRFGDTDASPHYKTATLTMTVRPR